MSEKIKASNNKEMDLDKESISSTLTESGIKFDAKKAEELANSKRQEIQNTQKEKPKEASPESADALRQYYSQRKIARSMEEPGAHYLKRSRADFEKQRRELVDSKAKTTQIPSEKTNAFKRAISFLTGKLGIKNSRNEKTISFPTAEEIDVTELAYPEASAEITSEKAVEEVPEPEESAEDKALLKDMIKARDFFDRRKDLNLKGERIQEIVERDLNKRLLKIDTLDEEAASGNPEVQKRTISYDGAEIPVYDLSGLPFAMITHTVDYRKSNNQGEIGTETYRMLMEDPSIWTQRQDEAEKQAGYGTRNGNARGNTISVSYHNSERNLKTYIPGSLVYGFEKVEADSVIQIYNGDGGTQNMGGTYKTKLTDTDPIDRLESATFQHVNEILLRRYSENGFPKKPDYIMTVGGNISQDALRHAKFFGIPIINVDESEYVKKSEARGAEMLESIETEDDYLEIHKKISELQVMPAYRGNILYTKPSIGRGSDVVDNSEESNSELGQKCIKALTIEQVKRVEYLTDEIEKAAKAIEEATAQGLPMPKTLTQFSAFKAAIITAEARGQSDCVEIDFSVKGDPRPVKTEVYDGEHPYQLEAMQPGDIGLLNLDNANSSYYQKLEPIVRRYLKAIEDNKQANKNNRKY